MTHDSKDKKSQYEQYWMDRFTAASFIFNERSSLGINATKNSLTIAKVKIETFTTLYQLATRLGIDIDTLSRYNRSYTRSIIPGNQQLCYLNLPHDRVEQFLSLGMSVYNYTESRTFNRTEVKLIERVVRDTMVVIEKEVIQTPIVQENPAYSSIVYEVKGNESMSEIAEHYETSDEDIKLWNGLEGNSLRSNQKLIIRVPTEKLKYYRTNRFTPTAKLDESKTILYTVRSGDIIESIADLYDCTIKDVKQWNGLTSDFIDVNQKLKIFIQSANLSYYKKIDSMTNAEKKALRVKD